MIKLHGAPVRWKNGAPSFSPPEPGDAGRAATMAYKIMEEHRLPGGGDVMRLRFDALISHDITYVGIIQTAIASGLARFPMPYALTNCHNSLCAVGGTINADDHVFGLSAARKYGGIFVPPNVSVIHQYARETLAKSGGMILGSDSHTRFGPFGCMGIGEGGPELVKQLLGDGYEAASPQVVLVYLTGAPARGVGPHDVAIALCGAVYKNGFVKNRILEFAGPGVAALSMEYRVGIDVMTTETACLSSVWQTDGRTEEYLAALGRSGDYRELSPGEGALYDSMVSIDLSSVEPMAALPFHPSEAYTLRELLTDGGDILREAEKRAEAQFGGTVSIDLHSKLKNGKLLVQQGVIAGCAGGLYENLAEAAAIIGENGVGSGYFELSVYPASMPVELRLLKSGVAAALTEAGAVLKPAFCGPCFGAGDVPPNGGLSVRHTTRNFPNREGSRPADGQLSAVMLMDARSIAATAARGGVLTPATDIDYAPPAPEPPVFDGAPYEKRVYNGFKTPLPDEELIYGPNIAPWPKVPALPEDMLIELAAVIEDEVTTTDELIPSGETSSYRSNPMKLAEFTLSRRAPDYVSRAKAIAAGGLAEPLKYVGDPERLLPRTGFGSAIFARKPGDGSAREQAASCQRVLGGCANFCYEYATRRYRANCINWGILPFTLDPGAEKDWRPGDRVYIPGVREAVRSGKTELSALLLRSGAEDAPEKLTLRLEGLTEKDREILLRGCLMNWYAANGGKNG